VARLVLAVLAAVPTVLVVIFASILFQSGISFWFGDRARGPGLVTGRGDGRKQAGPGVRRSDMCKRLADALLQTRAALALDVALLESLEPLQDRALQRPTLPALLPNAKELASLLDCGPDDVEQDPVGCGTRAAELYRSIVLVKGVVSHVVTPDGNCWTYEGGAAGLGVSGSGDVLAGIVGGLLARGADPLSALLWSVWLHGEAGARLAEKIGPIGFLAREIADEVPALLPR